MHWFRGQRMDIRDTGYYGLKNGNQHYAMVKMVKYHLKYLEEDHIQNKISKKGKEGRKQHYYWVYIFALISLG